jgi:hypothetical protein
MSERPSTPNRGSDPTVGPASEALAKMLSELRDLTPAGSKVPEPAFPPRLHKVEKPPARPQKIAFEFEDGRRGRPWALKAAVASAALFPIGAVAANFAHPLLTGPASPLRFAFAERTPGAGLSEAASTREPSLRATAVASAGRDAGVPIAASAAADEAAVSATGAMPTHIGAAQLVLPMPAPELPPPSAPAAPPANEPASAAAQEVRQSEPIPQLPVVTTPMPEDARAPAIKAGAAAPPFAPAPVAESGPKKVEVASLGEVKPSAPTPDPGAAANAERLVKRAQDQILQGDISGARLVLERALASGSAQAAFTLAQTYDPQMLAQWHAIGIKGDAERARQLYQLAAEKGVAEAKERMASFQ